MEISQTYEKIAITGQPNKEVVDEKNGVTSSDSTATVGGCGGDRVNYVHLGLKILETLPTSVDWRLERLGGAYRRRKIA